MKITAQQFVSNQKVGNSFVSIFKYFSNSGEKHTEREGDLYCLLNISGKENIPAERISKFVWDGILDGYLYSNEKSTNNALKDAINEGIKKLRDLIKNDKTLEELGVNVDFVLIAQRKEGLYIGNLGENEIYAYKAGKFVDISEILKKSRANTAGIALEEQDILVVSTSCILEEYLNSLSNSKDSKNVVLGLKALGNSLNEAGGFVLFLDEQLNEASNVEEAPAIVEQLPLQHHPKDSEKYAVMAEHTVKYARGRFFQGYGLIKDGAVEYFSKIKGWIKNLLGNRKWFKKVASKVSEIKINTKPITSMKGMRIDGYKTKDLRTRRIRVVVIGIAIIVLLALGINFTSDLKITLSV